MKYLKISNKLVFLAILLVLTSCSTTKKLSNDIDSNFKTLKAFETGFSGFVLYDPEENEIVYEHHGEKYFTPASNTKLFTFYTGLMVLGDSVPALKYAVHNDSLVFWGTGDPSFLHEKFPYSQVFQFLKEREEELFFAPPKYDEEHFGPGWAWGDYNWYYSVERGAFPMYGNYVSFHFHPSDSLPEVYPTYFQNKIEMDKDFKETRSSATRNRLKNHFVLQHKKGNKKRGQVVPFIYSSELIVELLSDTLNKKVQLLKNVPVEFAPKKTLYSIPTDSLYKRMLQVSDNFIAEQILLMSAQEIADTLKTEIAIDYMKEHHLKDFPDEPQWVDGSGLSRYNLFTPRSLVKLLEKIKNEVPQERLFSLLPAGGESGTIKNLYKADEPYIFAKTGTLNATHALSGYLRTKKGKILIFSFMNNNYTVPSARIKDGMEKILRNIYLNY